MPVKANWGSRAWFDARFDTPPGEGDAWGHRWRASQRLRHYYSLEIVRRLQSEGGLDILDVGCGLGEFSAAMAAVHPANRVVGVELSEAAVSQAREAHTELEFRVGSLPDLPVPDAAFDLVTALEVLYYLDAADRRAAVQELRRVLRPGGHLAFSSALDDGRRYFTESGAVALLEPAFVVEEVCTLHGRLYGVLERPFLKLRTRLRGVADAPGPIGAISRFYRRSIKVILGFETPAWFLERLARLLPGRPGRSHVMIVARKEDDGVA